MNFYSRNRAFVNTGLISGLAFALIMAAFDYFSDKHFSLTNFIMHFVLFGLFNGYWAYSKHKKQKKEQENQKNLEDKKNQDNPDSNET